MKLQEEVSHIVLSGKLTVKSPLIFLSLWRSIQELFLLLLIIKDKGEG